MCWLTVIIITLIIICMNWASYEMCKVTRPHISKSLRFRGKKRYWKVKMAESVAQRRDTQVMEMTGDSQHHDDVNEVGPRNRSRSQSPSDVSCWECGQRGHYQRDCPLKAGGIGILTTVPEGVVGQLQHVFTANSDITNKNDGWIV